MTISKNEFIEVLKKNKIHGGLRRFCNSCGLGDGTAYFWHLRGVPKLAESILRKDLKLTELDREKYIDWVFYKNGKEYISYDNFKTLLRKYELYEGSVQLFCKQNGISNAYRKWKYDNVVSCPAWAALKRDISIKMFKPL